MSSLATPHPVAPLPARRARQMFFVADYDAVCAIMTTSLFLSSAPSFSLYLTLLPSPSPSRLPQPRRFPLGGWMFFFLSLSLSLSLSLFLSRSAIFSLPTRTNFALASAARYDVARTRKRRLSSFSFSLWLSRGIRRIFGFSFSHPLLYISSLISFPLRSIASIG